MKLMRAIRIFIAYVLGDCNRTRAHNHLVPKRTLNYLASLAKCLSVRLVTKWLWVRVLLQSLKFHSAPASSKEFLDI